jgi:DNA gyrase subunit B
MEVALLNRGLAVLLAEERAPGGPVVARFRFADGVRDFVAFIDAGLFLPGSLIPADVIGVRMRGSPDGRYVRGGPAVAWHLRGADPRIHGYAGSRLTSEGGTHVEGFREGLAAGVDAVACQQGRRLASEPGLSADVVVQGLAAVVSVKLDRPEFLGTTRGCLGNTTVRTCVAEAVRDRLGTWLAEHPEQAAEIAARVVPTSRD